MPKFLHHITIPDDLKFSDLQLSRDPHTRAVRFRWEPIERICQESGLDIAYLRDQTEDNVAGLIVAWYAEHRKAGGEPDPVEEQLIAEIRAEDAAPLN